MFVLFVINFMCQALLLLKHSAEFLLLSFYPLLHSFLNHLLPHVGWQRPLL